MLKTAGLLAGAGGLYLATVRGSLTLDLGVGRRTRPLGPQRVQIAAPRELVFEIVEAPYRRTPRAMADKLEVLERGSDLVLAAHHTPLGRGLTATTVETVHFERPGLISFRLLRGPVPHVTETFELEETEAGTELVYPGELGTDLWALGAAWGSLVAKSWEQTVEGSLAEVKEEAERRARDTVTTPTYRARLRLEGSALAGFGALSAALVLAFGEGATDGPISTVVQLAIVALIMATLGVFSVRRSLDGAVDGSPSPGLASRPRCGCSC